MNAVDMHAIKKSFSGKKALDGVSFTINKGEIFGLLGPSGAGKTTIIKILTGQLMQDSGQAALLGSPCSALGQEILSSLGMVMDNGGFYKRLSALDNLKIFASVYGIGHTRIEEVLEQVGLKNAGRTPAGRLSKGQQQRLLLARAILHRPRLLLLDEPSSGLDPATARTIHQLILSLQTEGTTILLTTHNMEEAASLCDHVALLNDGRIVEYGNPKDLCLKYNGKRQLELLLKDGRRLSLPATALAAEEVAGYLRTEAVEAIHSTEPNLEAVFIELTGRKLA